MCKKVELYKVMIKKYIYLLLTCIWICLIFSFSLQPGEKSDVLSDGVGEIIIENSSAEMSQKFDTMSYEEMRMFHLLIRKTGHFAEFFVLGVLMTMTWKEIAVVHKKCISFALCVVVAATDETIQLFISGRSGQVSDVLLDCFGSLVGMCVCTIVLNLILHKKIVYNNSQGSGLSI